MTTLTTTLLVALAVGAALIGGIFFAFSNFVMKALARLPAPAAISAMQSINIVVLNKWFLGLFSGLTVMSLALTVLSLSHWGSPSTLSLLIGTIAYVAGCWLVTIIGNVPLNNRLAEIDPSQPSSAEQWQAYLTRWTRLNSQRALAALVAASLFCVALIV